MTDLTGLGDDQLNAVNWQKGPLLVLAGPGSGKIHALAHGMVRLINESTTWDFRVLALLLIVTVGCEESSTNPKRPELLTFFQNPMC